MANACNYFFCDIGHAFAENLPRGYFSIQAISYEFLRKTWKNTKWRGVLSDAKNVTFDVPQGSITGPFLGAFFKIICKWHFPVN